MGDERPGAFFINDIHKLCCTPMMPLDRTLRIDPLVLETAGFFGSHGGMNRVFVEEVDGPFHIVE